MSKRLGAVKTNMEQEMMIRLCKGMLFAAALVLAGCSTNGAFVAKPLSGDEQRRVDKGELVRLQQVVPPEGKEKLALNAAAYPRGVYVCAIESLAQPCLPKLSELVGAKLSGKGVTVVTDPGMADATLYFETWFRSYSTHASRVKGLDNPAIGGQDFAAKMEQSLMTGTEPEVHKRFAFAADPISLMTLNANDEQKFIYVALTAVDMKDAMDYPGEGSTHKGANKHPWVQPGVTPRVRTLIANYDGVMPTEKSVTPMLNEAVDLLVERVVTK